MKIAMLTTVERCGIAAYARELVKGLETLPDTTIEVVPIEVGRQTMEHYRAQAERFNAPDVDVVHIQHEHSFWGGILPRHSAFWEMRYLIEKPVVLTAHTTTTLAEMLRVKKERRPAQRIAKEILIRRGAYRESVETAPFATAITIVHTEAARQELIARGVKASYVTVIPTGIPAPFAAPTNGQAFRQRFQLNGRRVLTIFGYITPNKGYELTFNVLPQLPDNVTLVIAGSARNESAAIYETQMRAALERSGQTGRVLITGYLSDEDVAEAMQASDLVLVPHTDATGSYSVTLPLTQGRPTLASDLACFKEIAGRVDCLELFQAGNVEDYAQKLNALLENTPRREQLAKNARRYSERTSWPRVAEMTRKVYQNAIKVYGTGPTRGNILPPDPDAVKA